MSQRRLERTVSLKSGHSGGTCQGLLVTWLRLARRTRRIKKTYRVPRDNDPTEADRFRVFPVHAGRVGIMRRTVTRMKPVQQSWIEGMCRADAPCEVVQTCASHSRG